jgi:RNA polymerase sigma-70 factor, ECF subfamily
LTVPAGRELAPRRDAVLHALLLMFNAGWQAPADEARELCWEAIRLARALAAHAATAHPQAEALAALLLLHGARLTGRHDAAGEIVPLPGQPRHRWDQGMVRLGLAHLARAQRAAALSRWHLMAGIAAEHALAADYESTNWPRIVDYYDSLLALDDSAAPRLSHAIALAEAGEASRARDAIKALLPSAPAALKPHAHAALAHALDRLDERAEARRELQTAIQLARNEADRRLLQRRLDALPA